MISLMNNTPLSAIDELPAKSSPPWVWFGFFFAFAFLICEFLDLLLDLDHESFHAVFVLIVFCGWIYWLFCVFKFHTILREISRNHYPITGAEAVGRHFIPFYNFVWMFRWPAAFSDYLNSRGRVKVLSGNVLGALLVLSLLLRFIDGSVGLAVTFGVGMYMSAKLRRHMEMIKNLTPEMLPPPPDASMFARVPEGHEKADNRVEPINPEQQ